MSKVIGRRYGKLVVLSANPMRHFLCRCDCGKEIDVWYSALARGTKTSCGCGTIERKNIVGGKFGRLTVLRSAVDGKYGKWFCRCECGKEGCYNRYQLISGNTRSCGCLQRDAVKETGFGNFVDLSGQRFGRLVAIRPEGVGGKKWLFRCDCGENVVVRSGNVVKGDTKSCGCLRSEMARIRWYNPALSEFDRETNRGRRADQRNIEWRDAVLSRDKYRCRACGGTGRVIAHHKNAWASYPESRFDIDNGATSCLGCHSDFHNIYGRGKNTVNQWDEFVRSRKHIRGLSTDIGIVNIGEKYGKLTVKGRSNSRKGHSFWECVCDCGNECEVGGSALVHRRTISCGCLRIERIREHHHSKKVEVVGKN